MVRTDKFEFEVIFALTLKKIHSIKKNVGRLRFELRTSRLKAGCSTAELATHFVKSSTYEIIPF